MKDSSEQQHPGLVSGQHQEAPASVAKPTDTSRGGLGNPLLIGSLAAAAFLGPLHTGIWSQPFLERYFIGHPVAYLATTLFFIGMAALAEKAIGLKKQFACLPNITLGPRRTDGQPVSDAAKLIGQLADRPRAEQESYFGRRLREALEFLQRRKSVDALDEQIRYLADVDGMRMHSSFALVRIIIWAIPILGFLGTVIGITVAIANLSPDSLEDTLPLVTAGLGVAFDTTALSLGLSMLLMFSQYKAERFETRLLSDVDARTGVELVGRFQQSPETSNPQVAAVHAMTERVVTAVDQLVKRQTTLWSETIGDANRRWTQLADRAGDHLTQALAASLTQSLQQHATQLAQSEEKLARRSQDHWSRLQETAARQADAAAQQQTELSRQGDILLKVVNATGVVANLETELNQNLSTLAGAKHFEETVTSLAAAIHLLSARLGVNTDELTRVDLTGSADPGKAA